MIMFDVVLAGAFFVGGMIVGAVAVAAIVFTGWCYHWPRGLWK